MWTVAESDIHSIAVKTLMELEQVLAEPSAATPIAAMADHPDDIRGKRVAAIVTGAHLSMSLLPDTREHEGAVMSMDKTYETYRRHRGGADGPQHSAGVCRLPGTAFR